jgi:hypothetical protein
MFASIQTAEKMMWHYKNQNNTGELRHPADGEAWKHFDKKNILILHQIRAMYDLGYVHMDLHHISNHQLYLIFVGLLSLPQIIFLLTCA